MNRHIIYYDTVKSVGLSVEMNEFRGRNYVHISLNKYDPDDDFWYRTKGLSITEEYVSPIIIGLERIEQQFARINLPDVRQLEFDFTKDVNEKQELVN
jgi:hypothetical protein